MWCENPLDSQIVKRCEKEITVVNRLGLHARPAAMIVRLANTFKADIALVKDGEEVNCKSVLALMMLAAGMGTVLQIVACDHEDAAAAVEAIAGLFADKFGEE